MADEIRRLRTQAERDADGSGWRAAAQSRPGYATYPGTAPGSPSWWLRGGPVHTPRPVRLADDECVLVVREGVGLMCLRDHEHHDPAYAAELATAPTPVDGETCTKWCGFCHLGNSEHEPPAEQPPTGVVPPISFGFIADPPPPRRRWWHRYTRRNP